MSSPHHTELVFAGDRYGLGEGEVIDLSIPLEFGGPQPSHFGAPPATAVPLQAGGFTGDTRQGGSCNCEVLTLVPHCNGTHTEGVGHITRSRRSVRDLLTGALYPARLITVTPVPAQATGESSRPPPRDGDHLLTHKALEAAGLEDEGVRALIVRTRPNDESKRARDWSRGPVPAYFTAEAVEAVVAAGVEHLLIDLPSLDRSHDEGRLTGHRIFWGMSDPSNDTATRPNATITEMIYVPDSAPDGLYGLAIHVPPFESDAAPSRPLLYPLTRRPAKP